MTLTGELKILHGKIKANQAQYDLGREAAKIPTLFSEDLLEKYEYLTGEDLVHRPSMLEKTKFEYSPFGMSFSKAFKKDKAKSDAKSKSDFNYDSNYKFDKFFKKYDKFKEMSLDSMQNRIKGFDKLLTDFKVLKPRNPKTQLKKEQIMKNPDKLYCAYKNECDADNDLDEAKKKKIDHRQFQLGDNKDEDSNLTALPKWLNSKNDFHEAIKLIEDIRADANNVKSCSGDKKVFNNLDKLIQDIKNKKTTKENSIKK